MTSLVLVPVARVGDIASVPYEMLNVTGGTAQPPPILFDVPSSRSLDFMVI